MQTISIQALTMELLGATGGISRIEPNDGVILDDKLQLMLLIQMLLNRVIKVPTCCTMSHELPIDKNPFPTDAGLHVHVACICKYSMR